MFDEVVLHLSLVSVLSSSLLPITVIWLPPVVVLTIFELAVVRVHVVVPVLWLFRNSSIDGDLSMRFKVCNKIGPSFVAFLLHRCWRIMEPSGKAELLSAEAAEVNVVTFDVVDFLNTGADCNRVVPLIPFPFNAFASTIWLLALFSADWITNLFDSFSVCLAVLQIEVVNEVFCKRSDDELAVLHIVLSSSLVLLKLTAPLFNRLNNSWPFCKIIWPFSVRAPRIKIMLLDWCCCGYGRIN